jgi:shikimate dehydrogenase
MKKVFGILGYPLSHTLSPIIHNGLYKEYNLEYIYLVLEKEKPTKKILLQNDSISFDGLSVTIPHKEWAFKNADFKDEASQIMKASNTLFKKEDKIYAYNTDGMGAVRAILEYSPFVFNSEKDILILGSGGSARGISYSILKQGLSKNKICISARNSKTSTSLVKDLNKIQKDKAYTIPLEELKENHFGLIIHTTPMGMKGKETGSILELDFLHKENILFDIVYNPLETELVKLAKLKGCKIIPGYEMLIYQAMEQFFIFTEIKVTEKQIEKVRNWVLKKLYSE